MFDPAETRRLFVQALDRGLSQRQAEEIAAGLAPMPPLTPAPAPAPPPDLARRIEALDDLAELRVRYRIATGKKPFHGWDAATLKAKIAEAGGK